MGNQPNEEGGFSEIDYDKLRDVGIKKFLLLKFIRRAFNKHCFSVTIH